MYGCTNRPARVSIGPMSTSSARRMTSSRDMQAFDTLLFRGEKHPRTRSMLVAVCVLDRAPDHGQLAERLERASRSALRLRQKVVSPSLALLLPSWIVDPDFDLAHHLHFTRVRRGGTLQDVLDLVQQEVAIRLDPALPLWQARLVDGLRDGTAALIIKMSHAVADGVGTQRLFDTIFEHERDKPPGPMPELPVPEDVTPEELTREALDSGAVTLARGALGLWRGLAGIAGTVAASPRQSWQAVREYLASVQRLTRSQGLPAPALRGRSARRRCAAFDMPLDALKRAGKASGASVNDVYLCGIATALHRYLDAVGMPVATLPIAVPVNLRRGHEPDAGNYFGAIGFALPVAAADPGERLVAIRDRMRRGRDESALGLPQALAPLLARLPAPVADELVRRMPLPDIQASNVAGSAQPLYLAGARVLRFWPFGPVPGVAAMFTMHSLDGVCHVGVNFDAAAITRADLFAASLRRGFQETLALAGSRVPRLQAPLLGKEPAQ